MLSRNVPYMRVSVQTSLHYLFANEQQFIFSCLLEEGAKLPPLGFGSRSAINWQSAPVYDSTV